MPLAACSSPIFAKKQHWASRPSAKTRRPRDSPKLYTCLADNYCHEDKSMPPSEPRSKRACLTEQIVDQFVQFCTAVFAVERESWLSVELTMPQVKTLLLIVTWGRATGSRLGSALGAGLPSVTRLVD